MLLFNRYEYNPQSDFIGRGGFSKVYKAYDKKFQRWVALKVYKTNDLADRYSPMAEIQRVIDLDHPNICRYIDFDEVEREDSFGEKENVQVGVMELLSGGNFLTYYTETRDIEVFRKLLTDVLHGLGYLHMKGIIHRDIKPANILIKQTETGPVAKITDFGISKKSDSSNSATSSALIVSIPYMAPEQLNVQKYGIGEKVSFNIDFWSLGVAVFEIITGKLLFKNSDQETSEQIMLNILSPEVPEKISQLPQPYREFVKACLQKDAKLRIQRAEDLLKILTEYKAVEGDNRAINLQGGSLKPEFENGEFEGDETRPIQKPQTIQEKGTLPIPDPDDDPDATRLFSRPTEPKKEPEAGRSAATESIDETRILPGRSEEKPAVPKEVESDEDDTRLLRRPEPNEVPIQASAPAMEKSKDGTVTLFSRYDYVPVTDLIGKGGFSRVYRAQDKKLSRWVALKIYKVEQFTDRYSPIAEIKRVISFDHPNICRYLDIEEIEKRNLFGEIETVQVCVMELLDGGNFYEYYDKNRNLETFRKLLGDVFSGLSYLHRNGIIHRDIKPANILIKETLEGPVAKITDFGISKKSDSVNSESSSSLIVSIPYMAPEQLNLKKYGLDEKIRFNLDLWSLGVTIYEVLTGKLLFKNSENESSEQVMANIMSPDIPEKIKDLPSPFREIVTLCVVKNARDRVQRVEELILMLNKKPDTSAVPEPTPPKILPVLRENNDIQQIPARETIPVPPPQPEHKPAGRISFSDFDDEPVSVPREKKKPVPKAEPKKPVKSSEPPPRAVPPAIKTPDTREPVLERRKLMVSTPIWMLMFVVLAGSVMFFYFRSKRSDSLVQKNKPEQVQPVVSNPVDSGSGKSAISVPEPVKQPPTAAQTSATDSPKTSSVRIPVTTVRPVNPDPGLPKNTEHRNNAPRVAKNLSQELLLKFTPTEPCTITIKNLTAGYVLDTEELLPKKTLNVYLKPGKYSIVATSNRDSSKVRNYDYDVKAEDVNQIITKTISF